MKKLSIFLLLIIIPFIVFARLQGDVDDNNKVDTNDYIKIRKHLLKMQELTENELKRADINNDGKINSSDYILVRKIIMGLYSPLDSDNITVYFHNPGFKNEEETDGGFKSDAIFIKTSNKSIIIDGGLRSRNVKINNETVHLNNNLVSYLKSIGIKKIDYYIGSHGHPDHVGMAGILIKEFKIDNIIVPVGDVPNIEGLINSDNDNKWFVETENNDYKGTYKNYTIAQMLRRCVDKDERLAIEKIIANGKVQYLWSGYDKKEPYTFKIGTLKFSVLNPLYEDWPSKDLKFDENGVPNKPINQNSLVLRMDNGNNSFLFAGDNSNVIKNRLMYKKYGELMHVDVYKNAHHHDRLRTEQGELKERYKFIHPKYVVLPSTDVKQFNGATDPSNFKISGEVGYFLGIDGVYSINCGPVVIQSDGSNISVIKGNTFYKKNNRGATCKNLNYD